MPRDIGDKIGPRLAQLIGQYTLAARRDHAPVEARIRQAATQKIIDKAGHEFADHIGPIIAAAIDANPDMDPKVKDYLTRTASGRHQLQAVAGHIAMAGAGSVLSTLLSNELAPFAYSIVGSNPHLRLDAPTAAAAYAVGNFSQQDMYNEGAASGFNSIRMDTLHGLAQAIPDSSTIGDMVNRGLLSQRDAGYWVQRGGYGGTLHGPLLALRKQLISPADAALAVLKGVIDQAKGEQLAAANGVDAADFGILLGDTGEPPAPEQLGQALRRGFINQTRFEHGIRQSRIRNEWLDVLDKLRFEPMSTADAIDAAVQGHLAVDQAMAKALQNGLEAADFQPLLDTAGEPLSRTEMEQLYNRGEVTEAAVKQALRESRIKNKYIDSAFKLHERLPAERQVVTLVTHGAISHKQGVELLMRDGFSAEIAGWLITGASNAKLQIHKELTVAEIRQLFGAGVFTVAHAVELLGHLGYDAAEADSLIKGWDLLTAATITRQAIGAIRSRYVARHITATQAKADLEQLNVTGVARDRYLQIWAIELAATATVLTEAQIVHAHNTQLIDGAEAYKRLRAKGYDDADAHILLSVKPGAALPA